MYDTSLPTVSLQIDIPMRKNLKDEELKVYFQGKYTVTLIEGDGIGPEISQSVIDIFAAAKVSKHQPTVSVLLPLTPSTGTHKMGIRGCNPSTKRRPDRHPRQSH